MGEYAKRISDGAEIKVGTCNWMYYARYSQRNDFEAFTLGSKMNLIWRLPFLSEDCIQVGDFKIHDSWKFNSEAELSCGFYDAFATDECFKEPHRRFIQLYGEGVNIEMPCYHGFKLPDNTGDIRLSRYGSGLPRIRLSGVKNTETELLAVLSCVDCGTSWTMTIDEVLPHVVSPVMRSQLQAMRDDYRIER